LENFLVHLGYEVLLKDKTSVPRDCVWICRAPDCQVVEKLLSL